MNTRATLFLMPLLFLTSPTGQANCSLINKAKLSLPVLAENWNNAETTRTPEGGAYKFQELSCVKQKCKINQVAKFKKVYEPQHPDADEAGYVTYPDFDKNKERIHLLSYANILRLTAHRCSGIIVTDNRSAAVIKYPLSVEGPKLDIFNFKPGGGLASWMREDSDGTSHTVNLE